MVVGAEAAGLAALGLAAALGFAAVLGFAAAFFGAAAFLGAAFFAAGFFYAQSDFMFRVGWYSRLLFSGDFLCQFQGARVSWCGGEYTGIQSSFDCSFELPPRQRSRHHDHTTEQRRRGGERYLRVKVGGRGFVVALDVLFDCLAG